MVFKSPQILDFKPFDVDSIIGIIIGFLVVWIIAMSDFKPYFLKFKANKESGANQLEIMMDFKKVTFKKASQFNTQDFPTYPRFTVYINRSGEKGVNPTMVFDSSDYDEINEVFGIADKKERSEIYGNCQSIRKGMEIYYHGNIYEIDYVYVDILDFFDDYSKAKSQLHVGEDTPYNIQIQIYLKDVKNRD